MRTVSQLLTAMEGRRPLRYRIHTYGCQMNERDSESIAAMLEDLGYRAAGPDELEDLVIFNTCCVRDNAERKIIGKVLEYRLAKEDRPDLLVGVGGCMTQQVGAAERLVRRAPWLDFVFGTHNTGRLPVLLAMAATRARLRTESGGLPRGPVVEVWPEPEVPPLEGPRRAGVAPVQAFVNVSFGCNNFCSYCIVPHVRGRERSRTVDSIVKEAVGLARAGTREVVLLGQNVNSYGRDLADGTDFASLLSAVDRACAPEGLARVRFMTSHPKDLSGRLIEAMASLPTVCEHIHLPVQSGSTRILELMNRRYTSEHYLDLIARLRDAMPEAGITTDVIVGFPGETEDDFEQTLSLMRAARFDGAFTFAYSQRRGTEAADMPDQVPAEVKRQRLAALNAVQEEISRARLARLAGTEQEVLFYGPSDKDPAVIGGRTRGFHYVLTPGDANWSGRLGRVRISATRTWTLTGEPVDLEPPRHPEETHRTAQTVSPEAPANG